jgi:hypothetical protein
MTAVKEMTLLPKGDAALAPVAEPSDLTLFERMARDPSVDVDKFERLMAMRERMTARFAKEQFNAAMSAAQKQMRAVGADAYNPQTKSRYASYEALDAALRPLYTEQGFGLSFNTEDCPLPEHVRVACEVSHAGGHSQPYHIDMPADGKGAKGGDVMTRTHATGAAVAYGMRYLLKMIFNVAVGDQDDDGNSASAKAKKTEVQAPAGFEEWLHDLQSAAENGTPVLSAAWKASKEDYRKYIKAIEWERLKRVAVTATAAAEKGGR